MVRTLDPSPQWIHCASSWNIAWFRSEIRIKWNKLVLFCILRRCCLLIPPVWPVVAKARFRLFVTSVKCNMTLCFQVFIVKRPDMWLRSLCRGANFGIISTQRLSGSPEQWWPYHSSSEGYWSAQRTRFCNYLRWISVHSVPFGLPRVQNGATQLCTVGSGYEMGRWIHAIWMLCDENDYARVVHRSTIRTTQIRVGQHLYTVKL